MLPGPLILIGQFGEAVIAHPKANFIMVGTTWGREPRQVRKEVTVTHLRVCPDHLKLVGSDRHRSVTDSSRKKMKVRHGVVSRRRWIILMGVKRLAHISDIHLGRSRQIERQSEMLVEKLLGIPLDHIVLTGDLTHRGRHVELRRFKEIFAPLLATGKMTMIPGNHDRVGEDAGLSIMGGRRVDLASAPGLHLVRVDSTGPHNRSYFDSHGMLCEKVIQQVVEMLERSPPDSLRVVALHHHVLPLPEEDFFERFSAKMGWPNAAELALGPHLLTQIQGRCDLVLHGHRHVPWESELRPSGLQPLSIYNAGSSVEMGAFRVFEHEAGALRDAPDWVTFESERDARIKAPSPLLEVRS